VVSVTNLVTAIALLIFGVGYFLFGLAWPIGSGVLLSTGMTWAFFVSTPWTLAVYGIHLNEVGSMAASGFMRISWILALVATLTCFISALIMSFTGISGALAGNIGSAAAISLIIMGLALVIGIMLPGIAKIVARGEIGMPALGLVAEIFGMIFSVMLLIGLILLGAGILAFQWLTLIAGICGLAYGVLEAVSLFFYPARAAAPSRR
jgi:hypothetical protein